MEFNHKEVDRLLNEMEAVLDRIKKINKDLQLALYEGHRD